jgi:biopolymer transport protein TolQ
MGTYFGFEHIGSMAVIVLGILAAMSLFSWSFIIYKWFQLRMVDKKNKVFLNKFIDSENKDTLSSFAKANGSLAANLYILNKESYSSAATFLEIVAKDIEGRFSWLASVGSTSPFIGLFGTVWGIINAFSSIGSAQNVSIATVAPGISEALITTAAGIFVAVPAVIGYNILYSKYSTLIRELEGFLEAISHEKI